MGGFRVGGAVSNVQIYRTFGPILLHLEHS
jgi:hypothetical protein